jgi:hypothetical protein
MELVASFSDRHNLLKQWMKMQTQVTRKPLDSTNKTGSDHAHFIVIAPPGSPHIFLTAPDSSFVLDLHQSQEEQWGALLKTCNHLKFKSDTYRHGHSPSLFQSASPREIIPEIMQE